jgi:predicted RNA-binding protein Jag
VFKTFQGLTEAEAAIKACEALGISRSKIKYNVIARDEDQKRVVIEVDDEQIDEDDLQPAHLKDGPQSRAHPSANRRDGGRGDRAERGGRRDFGGGNRRGGRRDRPRRDDDGDGFSDTLAEEYKEFREMTAAPKDPVTPKPALDEGALSERAAKALETTRKLLELSQLNARAQVSVDTPDQVLVDMHGPDEGLIIGRKGETLLALQFMVNRIVGKDAEGPEKIALDCEGYRERRQEALRVLAKKLGDKAKGDNKIVTVSPMNAHDRRIFHVTLDGQNGIKTRSEGEGLMRRVLIIPDGVEG